MSPLARRISTLLSMGCVLLPLVGAQAQTIADYSRAQRAWLESTMSQAAARSAGLGASAPAFAASSPLVAATSSPRLPMPPFVPTVQVSGVFASRGSTVAEILVNATAYLLGAGQGVPGTSWHVESIAVDRVVLARQGGTSTPDTEGTRKVFPLPALH
jgi:type IV pilus biogenesis protein PilP